MSENDAPSPLLREFLIACGASIALMLATPLMMQVPLALGLACWIGPWRSLAAVFLYFLQLYLENDLHSFELAPAVVIAGLLAPASRTKAIIVGALFCAGAETLWYMTKVS